MLVVFLISRLLEPTTKHNIGGSILRDMSPVGCIPLEFNDQCELFPPGRAVLPTRGDGTMPNHSNEFHKYLTEG